MKTGYVWTFNLLIGFALEWVAFYWQRRSALGAEPSRDFVISFGIFSAITVVFAGIALAILFFEAYRSSRIAPPLPSLGMSVLTWVVFPALALISTKYSVGEGAFRMDELLLTLDALLCAVCCFGVGMALQIEAVREALLNTNIGR